MGIIVNKNEEQSELQQRITAELREKQARQSLMADAKNIKGPEYDSDKSEYLKDMTTGNTLGWVWAVGTIVMVAAVCGVVWLIIKK